MKQSFDAFLYKIFNNPQTLWANILFGVLILILGGFLINKNSSKGKKRAGLFYLFIGSFTIISNILQLFFPIF